MARRSVSWLLRPLAYLWASPATLLGLFVAGLSLASRGRVARVAGVIEVHGGAASGLLRRFFLLRGGVDAVALGHVVVGDSASALQRHREHERVHVRQYERWGPLFLPEYVAASFTAWARGRDPYLDNRFEREARERARLDSDRA